MNTIRVGAVEHSIRTNIIIAGLGDPISTAHAGQRMTRTHTEFAFQFTAVQNCIQFCYGLDILSNGNIVFAAILNNILQRIPGTGIIGLSNRLCLCGGSFIRSPGGLTITEQDYIHIVDIINSAAILLAGGYQVAGKQQACLHIGADRPNRTEVSAEARICRIGVPEIMGVSGIRILAAIVVVHRPAILHSIWQNAVSAVGTAMGVRTVIRCSATTQGTTHDMRMFRSFTAAHAVLMRLNNRAVLSATVGMRLSDFAIFIFAMCMLLCQSTYGTMDMGLCNRAFSNCAVLVVLRLGTATIAAVLMLSGQQTFRIGAAGNLNVYHCTLDFLLYSFGLEIGLEIVIQLSSLALGSEIVLGLILHLCRYFGTVPVVYLTPLAHSDGLVPITYILFHGEIDPNILNSSLGSIIQLASVIDICPGENSLCLVTKLNNAQHTLCTAGIFHICLSKGHSSLTGVLNTALTAFGHIVVIPAFTGLIVHHTAGYVHNQNHCHIVGNGLHSSTDLQGHLKFILFFGACNSLAGPHIIMIGIGGLTGCQIVLLLTIVHNLDVTCLVFSLCTDAEAHKAHHHADHQQCSQYSLHCFHNYPIPPIYIAFFNIQ